ETGWRMRCALLAAPSTDPFYSPARGALLTLIKQNVKSPPRRGGPRQGPVGKALGSAPSRRAVAVDGGLLLFVLEGVHVDERPVSVLDGDEHAGALVHAEVVGGGHV